MFNTELHTAAHIRIRTASEPVEELATVVCPRGVVRRVRLLEADGGRVNFALEIPGIGSTNLEQEDGWIRVVLDPTHRYSVSAAEGYRSVILDPNWQPPSADVPTTFRLEGDYAMGSGRATTPIRFQVRDSSDGPVGVVRFGWVNEKAPFGRLMELYYKSDANGAVDAALERHPGDWLMLESAGHGRITVAGEPALIRIPAAAALRIVMNPPATWRTRDWRLDVRAGGWHVTLPYRFTKKTVDSFRITKAADSYSTDDRHSSAPTHTLPPGAFGVLRELPPGLCEVRLWTDGYELKQSLRLVAGQTRTLSFAPH